MTVRNAFRGGAACALALACAAGCSDAPEAAPRAPVAAVVERAMADIALLEGDSPDVRIVRLDVSDLKAAAFRARLLAEKGARCHLWMPGERDWVLAVATNAAPVSLARAMARFADDPASGSVFGTFASYVGTLEEVLPAFASRLEGTVVPQWFVSREIPELAWLDVTDVEPDIRARFQTEMRSVQNARRTLLEGNMLACDAKDKEGEQKAIDCWSKARRLNPADPLLCERQANLRRNAEGFLAVLKVPQAMKCYETLFRIDPNDASAIYNFGLCLKRIGKTELAAKCLARAQELSKAVEASK